MRVVTKWALLIGLSALSLWAVAQVSTVTAELYPWIADNGVVVWQELYAPRRTDLFQPSATFPVNYLPTTNVGIRALIPPNPDLTLSNAARPQVSANGNWLVYYQADTTTIPPTAQVYVRDLTDPNATPKLISYKNWRDTDNDGVRDGNPTPSTTAILPAISGSGRIVAFLSQDPELNDPNGDGNGPAAPEPPSGRWLIYIHDRDADGNGTLDEAKVGGTTTRFLPDPSGTNPLFVRLTEVRLSLDSTGRALAFSVFDGTNWQLWYVADVQAPNPTLVAQSSAPFSIPSLAGSRLAFTASGPFSWFYSVPTLPAPGVHVIDILSPSSSGLIQTNGVNGMPMLSRDGNSLAFHSTGTAYSLDGKQWWLLTDIDANGQPDDYNGDKIPDFDRNAVDDVFMFDLTQSQPRLTWSSLILRANLLLPPFTACINPALPSSSVNLIAFQEIVNGASRIRIVDRSNNSVIR